ncbi:hypothetical protein SDC9_166117 [bioreactor metagenome]|uniref:FAD/NAD(P)-binding domain-containing protein n=1 Tax=bioreactor metagenome TaxID=1076179 RepID=A0A645G3P2_9ZZZZ
MAKVDENRKVIPGTEETISCDLLVLAVGLIPENELSVKAGIEMDPRTRGPVLDNHFMTSVPGIFAAGNVAVVFDLVDYVSESGEIAARGAAAYLNGTLDTEAEAVETVPGENVNFIVPQRMRVGSRDETTLFMRVKKPEKSVRLTCENGGETLVSKKLKTVAPPEMVACTVTPKHDAPLVVDVKEA